MTLHALSAPIHDPASLYLGIDPGKSGAMALLQANGDLVEVFPIPDTERDVVDLLGEFSTRVKMCFLEKVNAMPKQGVTSTFTFAQGYGLLRGILLAFQVRFDDVRPQVWQKALGCLSGGDKNVTKSKAQQLFPDRKITHAIADALLIAEYCRRVHK